MHGTSAGMPVTLSGYGGLVTLAKPETLPEGASPRTYDGDYDVGSWRTRAGLTNYYRQAVSNVGPNFPTVASSSPPETFQASPSSASVSQTGFGINTAFLGGFASLAVTNPTISVVVNGTVPAGGTVNVLYAFNGGFYSLAQSFSADFSTTIVIPISGSFNLNTISVELEAAVGIGGTYTVAATVTNCFVSYGSTWNNPGNILAADGKFASVSPVNTPNGLDAQAFTFNVPLTTSINGALLTVTGFSNSPCNLTAQLLVAGVPTGDIKTIALPAINGSFTFGSITDQWGLFLTPELVNAETFGVQLSAVSSGFDLATAFIDAVTLTLGVDPGTSNFQFITTFTAQNGDVKNLSLDANGNFYVEDVTNNQGVRTLAIEGITPNSYCVGVNGEDVEYLAFSDGLKGSDMPLQYTPNWTDRITQVGPGAAPTFSPIQDTADSFDIATITQPAAMNWTFAYGLQSVGPGSNAAGNVTTIYYSDATLNPLPDEALVTAFEGGQPVYLYQQLTLAPVGMATPQTVLVTSVGVGHPPDPVLGARRPFWYYTYTVPVVASLWGSGDGGFGVNYQQSLATLDTVLPVPALEIGDKITVTGASVPAWDAQWTITQTPNSGEYAITSSAVASGIATLGYAETGGTLVPPAVGQLVTITGTTNAGGALNVANATIVSSSGGASGTFTINVAVPDFASVSEDGLATTAGTVFVFDPGAALVGTAGNPIFGNSTGGSFVWSANQQFIANGTRQGTCFFITRNGYFTYPAVPVTFTTPENTTGIAVSNLPIGPPNVIARGIAITEAGQGGVPGANFFYIPTQVNVIVNDVVQTSTAFLINDNSSTSATLAFSDDVLLRSTNIGVYGYNLFNQIEIGDPAWIVSYADRNSYGLCWNKVQNFNNLSFDGGYLPNLRLVPLGWVINDLYGSLAVSAKFGNSWYIQNNSGGFLVRGGSISQPAYQAPVSLPPGTSSGTPIINANTTYSVRVTARIPSGIEFGNLGFSLTNGTNVLGAFTFPFSAFNTEFQILTAPLLTNELQTVPPALTLNMDATSMAAGADIEIDRIEIYPTAIPVLTTTVYFSYAGLPEQVDAVTGQVVFQSENQQPVNGAAVMYDTFYGMKGWAGTAPGASLYSLQSSSNLEPAQWQEPEVAQKSGAIGVLAYDFGEQWIVMANRNGLFLFEGGQPGKINHEIIQVWDEINWTAAKTIWVRNVVSERRLYIGVPLPTPNFWMPNAPINLAPETPNVILMLNYQGLDSGEQIKSSPQMHTTMFGSLTAIDMRRKWSLWTIPSPYANVCQGRTDQQLFICNGKSNSKIYTLDDTAETDDGAIIDSMYTTAGLPNLSKREAMPAVGMGRTRTGFMYAALQSAGLINVRFLPNRLLFPEPQLGQGYRWWRVPGGFAPGNPALNDSKCSVNFAGYRTFVEFRENDGHAMSLSNFQLHIKKDVWNSNTGQKTL